MLDLTANIMEKCPDVIYCHTTVESVSIEIHHTDVGLIDKIRKIIGDDYSWTSYKKADKVIGLQFINVEKLKQIDEVRAILDKMQAPMDTTRGIS